jgi:tetratricopeptide (TPR) repeat protein
MQLPVEIRGEFDLVAHQADLLGKLGRYEEELGLYDRLIKLRPELPGLWVSKANALRIMGRREEAVVTLRHVIETYPDYVRSWWLLSDLKDFRFDDADIATMTQLLDRTALPADRVPLHFALAKAFEDRGDAKLAFEHYAAGNSLRAETFDREMLAIPAKVERVIRTFDAGFLSERAGWGHDSNAPIFIVGLQRSGSTLIEQILASHPMIEGTAELPVMPQVLRSISDEAGMPRASALDRLAGLDCDRLRQLGQLYLDRAATYRHTDLPHFIDKLPGNWSNVGIIRLILPNAKIIDARRHPMAVGFSNFKQNYGGGGYFTNSLATIGRYYRDYLRLMTHFERIDPGGMHRVVNESLIEAFEPQVRALLDYVQVPFHAACLDFHRNRRAVATPSAEQVRRPINRDGVDQWRAFEPWLGELERALGPALEGWNLPPGTYRDESGGEA